VEIHIYVFVYICMFAIYSHHPDYLLFVEIFIYVLQLIYIYVCICAAIYI